MGFLDTDFGKMLVFMFLGGVILILVLGFSKAPNPEMSSRKTYNASSQSSRSPNISGDNPYEAANLIG